MLILHLVRKNAFIIILYGISLNFFLLGYTAKDNSFYASLHAEFTPQDREALQTTMGASNSKTIEYRFVKLFLNNLLSYLLQGS